MKNLKQALKDDYKQRNPKTCKHPNLRISLLLGKNWKYCPDCKEVFSKEELKQQKETRKKRKIWGKKLGKMRKLKKVKK